MSFLSKYYKFIFYFFGACIISIGFISLIVGIYASYNYNYHHQDCELLIKDVCSVSCKCIWCQAENKCLDLNFIDQCKSTTNIYSKDCSKNYIIICITIFLVWYLLTGIGCIYCRISHTFSSDIFIHVEDEEKQLIK